ncbi:MAG: hypothetical protein L6R28_12845 [Planctomycetes bacterium]|nr:hypothetical protein [Planctomycetota bacterium]
MIGSCARRKYTFRLVLRVACVAALLAAANLCAIEVVALRGASHEAPENSIPAIRLAWKQAADAVLLNLQITKDLQLVLMHDLYPSAEGGSAEPVSRLTHTQLKAFDIGKAKGEAYAGTRIPALTDVWETVPEKGRVFLVMETGNHLHTATANVLEKTELKNRVVLMSPFVKNLVEVRKRLPDLPGIWMPSLEEKEPGKWAPSPESLVSKLNADKLDGLYLLDCAGIDERFVTTLHAAKKKIYVWNVTKEEAVKRLRKLGVDGIMSERPEWLRTVLETPEPSETDGLDPPVMKAAIRGLNLGELKKTVTAKFEASKLKHGQLDTHGLFYESDYLEGCLSGDQTVSEIRVRYAKDRLKLVEVCFKPEVDLKALEKRLNAEKNLKFSKRMEKDVGDPKQRTEIYLLYEDATLDQPVKIYIQCARVYQYDHDRLVGSRISEPVLIYDYTALETH